MLIIPNRESEGGRKREEEKGKEEGGRKTEEKWGENSERERGKKRTEVKSKRLRSYEKEIMFTYMRGGGSDLTKKSLKVSQLTERN